jgi:hypothetical protein
MRWIHYPHTQRDKRFHKETGSRYEMYWLPARKEDRITKLNDFNKTQLLCIVTMPGEHRKYHLSYSPLPRDSWTELTNCHGTFSTLKAAKTAYMIMKSAGVSDANTNPPA